MLCERAATVTAISAQLQKKRFLIVKAPYFSGKTSLAQLMDRHFKSLIEVCYITMGTAPLDYTWNVFFKSKSKEDWMVWVNRANMKVLLLDEAQVTYAVAKHATTELWNVVKFGFQGQHPNVAILMFAGYGPGTLDTIGTPFQMPDAHIISLTPRPSLDPTKAIPGLLLTQPEFDEMMTKLAQLNFKLDDPTKTYLQHITGGHVGLLKRTLELLEEEFVNQDRLDTSLNVRVYKFLHSGKYATSIQRCRGLPDIVEIRKDKKMLRICDTILGRRKYSLATADASHKGAAAKLVKLGYVEENASGELIFPTPLYSRTFLIARHGQVDPSADLVAPDFNSFIIEAIRRMNHTDLQQSKSRSSNLTLLERQWQNTFYSVCKSMLPNGTFISPDVGAIYGSTGL